MRPSLLATMSVLALTLGASGLLRARARWAAGSVLQADRLDPAYARDKTLPRPGPRLPAEGNSVGSPAAAPRDAAKTDEITRNVLLYFIIPLSAAAGVADWTCHRASHIERTAGVRETLIHLVLLVEGAIPMLAGLFLEITSPVLALMIASFLAHEITALLDVSYAVTRRNVSPTEQLVHSYIEMAPLMAASFIAVQYRPQFLALLGFGPEAPDLSIRLKRGGPPMSRRALVAGGASLFEGLLYLEELRRDLKANPGRLEPPVPRGAAGQ
jgi:hypothetical protein